METHQMQETTEWINSMLDDLHIQQQQVEFEDKEDIDTNMLANAVDAGATSVRPENEIDGMEFKLLVDPKSPQRREKLMTQMLYRVSCTGVHNRASYLLGVADDGELGGCDAQTMRTSIENIACMARMLSVDGRVEVVSMFEDAGTSQQCRWVRVPNGGVYDVVFDGNRPSAMLVAQVVVYI